MIGVSSYFGYVAPHRPWGAAVGGANLYRSDLRGVAGLGSVRDLGRASFHQTVVTRKQLETIEKAFRSLAYFDVRQE